MILSDKSITQEINDGNIKFDPPIDDKDISPCSVDVHLGSIIYKFKTPHSAILTSIDLSNPNVATALKELLDPIPILGEGFSLQPNEFVIAYTKESVTLPPHIAGRIEGRSTNARFGITIHSTAPTIHPTWSGNICLEICNQNKIPCTLRAGVAIGQLIFEQVDSMPSRALSSAWLKIKP